VAESRQTDLSKIEMLVLDVDGVLTDGTIIVNGDGSESKFFNVADGHGIRLWRRAGLKVALLSGRMSAPTSVRAEQLEVDHCLQDCHDKLCALKELLVEAGLESEQVAFVGDDLPDLPPIRHVGFGVAVANAVEAVKVQADYVTERKGGDGAVREVIEHILGKSGKWDELMQRYQA